MMILDYKYSGLDRRLLAFPSEVICTKLGQIPDIVSHTFPQKSR